MQFQGRRCGWVSGQEVDFYIESDFFSLANVLLRQCSPWPTLSWQKLSWPQSSLPILSWPTLSWPPFRSPWPTLSCRYNIPTCGQGVEPNQCKCRFSACVKYFAQIPIFQNRDGSTFTPTSVTSPPCGGRPLNIDSCSCPNGNTITANNFIAAAVPLIQDILSGWVFEPMSHALCFYNTLIDPRNVKLLLFTMTSTTPINGRLHSGNEGACGTNSKLITLMYSPTK